MNTEELYSLDKALYYLNEDKIYTIENIFNSFISEYQDFNKITESVIINEANIKENIHVFFEKVKKLFTKFINFMNTWFNKVKLKIREAIKEIRSLKYYEDYIDDEEFEEFENEYFEDRVATKFQYVYKSEDIYFDNIDNVLDFHSMGGFMGAVLAHVEKKDNDKAIERAKSAKEFFDDILLDIEYADSTGDFDKDCALVEKALNMFNKELPRLEQWKNNISKEMKDYESLEKSSDKFEHNSYIAFKIGGSALTSEMNMFIRLANSMYSALNECSTFNVHCKSDLLKQN